MYRTITEVKEGLLSGDTVLSLTKFYIEKISQNLHLNAFLEVFEDSAIAAAISVDEKIKNGTAGKLAGVIVGIKDNICYKNHKVSAASKILEGFESIYTATALQRLLDEDAIVIGRLNCDEFAMGSSNENSAFGPVENNLKKNYVPGGSSGGSAVAVSAGLCTVSLGSDTGGSVRQPASWTGTYGMKPTYGRISRYGLIAYASSFDQILSHLQKIIQDLNLKGHEIIDLSFTFIEYLVPTYYVLTTAEASSNLSRFDGVHFGYRSSEAKGVDETYIKSRSEGFGMEVKRRIMAGTFVLSHGYYDAYYSQAQKVRRVLKNQTDKMFEKTDILLMPSTPGTAFEKNAIKDPIQMYLQDIFTVHANLTGNPALSIPLGNHSNGLPFGIQIMSNTFDESTLFQFAKILEDL